MYRIIDKRSQQKEIINESGMKSFKTKYIFADTLYKILYQKLKGIIYFYINIQVFKITRKIVLKLKKTFCM